MKNPIVFRYARHIIGFMIVAGTFAFLFLVSIWRIPMENQNIVSQAQGFILALSGVVASYYFGNSKDKSDADQAARTEGTTTTTSTTKI